MEGVTTATPTPALVQDSKTPAKTTNHGCIVKYLPLNYAQDAVTKLFSPFGTVVGVKIIKNHITGTSQGYGFVYYDNQKSAEDAVAAMNAKQIEGKTLRVALTDPAKQLQAEAQKSNVYIAGLPKSFAKNDLDTLFAKFGTIVESRVLLDPQGQSRGVGFVRYSSFQSAQAAISQMNGTIPPGGSDKLAVKLAINKEKENPAAAKGRGAFTAAAAANGYGLPMGMMGMGMGMGMGMPAMGMGRGYPTTAASQGKMFPATAPTGYYPPSATPTPTGYPAGYGENPYAQTSAYAGMPATATPTATGYGAVPTMTGLPGVAPPSGEGFQLFVFHLPIEYREEDLFKLFSHYGTVLSVKIITDPSTNSSRGYGFVNMASQQEASNAIFALNGFRLGNKVLKVDFKTAR